jgi:hypothetical protein
VVTRMSVRPWRLLLMAPATEHCHFARAEGFSCALLVYLLLSCLESLKGSDDLHSRAWPHSESRRRRCTPGSATRAFHCEGSRAP